MGKETALGAEVPSPPPSSKFASADSIVSSILYLKSVLASQGFGHELNLLSTDPDDVAATCNIIYGLMAQQQRDHTFREHLKQEVFKARSQLTQAEKEKARLEMRMAAKEREVSALTGKQLADGEGLRADLRAAKQGAEDAGRKLVGAERRVVQLQHEAKRKELEYERLQEKLSHILADKRKSEKAVLDMAGKVTQQLGIGPVGAGRVVKSDEGLKALIAAHEQKQAALEKENKDVKSALLSLQAEYKELVNSRQRQAAADAAVSSGAVSNEFIASMPSMDLEALCDEVSQRQSLLQRRLHGAAGGGDEPALLRGVVCDQRALLTGMLTAVRSSRMAQEALHQADMRRLVHDHQTQLAAAKTEWERARVDKEGSVEGELSTLRARATAQEAERQEAEAAAEARASDLLTQVRAAQAALEAAEARDRAQARELEEVRGRSVAASQAAAEAEVAAAAREAALLAQLAGLAAASAAAEQAAGARLEAVRQDSARAVGEEAALRVEVERREAALRAELAAAMAAAATAGAARLALEGRQAGLDGELAAKQAELDRLLAERAADHSVAQAEAEQAAAREAELRGALSAQVESARAEWQQRTVELERALGEARAAAAADLAAAREEAERLAEAAAAREAALTARLEVGLAASAELQEIAAERERELAQLQAVLCGAEREVAEARERSGEELSAALVHAAAEKTELETRLAAAEAASQHERARLEEQRRATEQERSDLTQTIAALRRQRDHFSAQQTEYKRLMRQYFPGMGAGTLLERALARKVDAAAQELDALVVPVQIPAGGV
uniref:Uncharacterized protein n=1 Tax=Auxenochlorella protothecoides TaxID=3075 RepID=A0A1D2A7K6_AUXPR